LQERETLRDMKDRLIEDVARLQGQIHQAEKELRKANKKESIERGKRTLSSVQKQLDKPAWEVTIGRKDEVGRKAGDISPGDRVQLLDNNVEGTVISLLSEGKQIEVQVGNTRLTVGIGNVEKKESPTFNISENFPMVKKSLRKMSMSFELDLRGKRADEVSGELDSYLNDAFLSHFNEVRIIHGYATGTVRQIVREILASHQLVKSFRPGDKDEGGDGVTMVQL